MFENRSYNTSSRIPNLATFLTDRDFGRESRSAPRHTVVCPATIQFQYQLEYLKGLTKDISGGGVCLITEFEIKVEQIATLTIYGEDDIPSKVRACCVWQKPIGQGYYQSGWRFLRRVLQNAK